MASDIDYVLGFVFSKDREMLLLIRKDHPAWQRGLYNGVGGKLIASEPPSSGMSRECNEEAGIRIMPDDWRSFAVMMGPKLNAQEHCAWRVFCFAAEIDVNELLKARTIEKEEICISNLTFLRYSECVHNMQMLLGAALDKNITQPITILYPSV